MTSTRIDPITVEVIRHRLLSNATDMSETIKRAAYSPIIYEVLDFSNSIHDHNGDAIVQADGIPLFLGAMSEVVYDIIQRFGDDIHEGDVFISNDPHSAGGTHLNDINIVVPIFYNNELMFFSNCKAHWIDIGGKDSGSWSADASNMYQEGIILPSLKLHEKGKVNQAVLDLIMANVRIPQHSLGDLTAQIAACRVAEKRTHEVIKQYGKETVKASVLEIFNHGERLARAEIEKIPDGVYEVEDYSDSDGITDKLIKVKTKVIVDGGDITVDFTGSDPQTEGGSGNCSLAATASAVRLAIRCLTNPDLPGNQGSYKPVNVIAPEGTCINPLQPSPVSVGLGDVCLVIIESVFRALSTALPDRVVGGMYGAASVLVIAGEDPRHNNSSYINLMPYVGGWGARATKDGMSGIMTIHNGETKNMPVEVIENKFPVHVERYQFMQDSGGPGKYRGGLGLAIDYRLHANADISVGLNRYNVKPYGIFEGKEGVPSVTKITYPDGTTEDVHKVGGKPVPEGSIVSHRCGGGGGYGKPTERDVELIEKDILNGYITEKAARMVYGYEGKVKVDA